NIDFDARDKNVEQYIELFSQFLTAKGLDVSYNLKNNDKNIRIILNSEQDSQLGKEGYTLEVNSNDIRLTANQPAGVFNGLQTLKLLFPAGSLNGTAANPILLQACKITDYPRFGWRGLMLDVSRHFFTVDEVKAFIDQMAAYKFNVFHWHLTDDQGWRIEIKSLPKLTEIGAWRVKRYGRFGTSRPDPEEGEAVSYGGYYTQDQIRDIVKYAQERNITIVPEIDMPGHSMAALAAYPELSVNKEPKYVSPGNKFSEWYGDGTFKMLVENTLNPTDEKVYDFVDKVFTEVAQLFPGTYIHMGGDEAYHGYWEQDPEVQKFMKKHKIKTSHELQSYFVKRVEKIINSKGKKMIGWDEILEGGLAENAAVMSWRGMQGGVEAAKLGHEVVMSPTTYTYIDYMQGDPSVENYIYSSLSLEKTYQFEPVPEGVDPKYILGGQGNLWTEEIPTMQFAFYMTYPRAFAIAESVWSPKEKKNWDDFERRVENHFQRFDAAEINISKAVYDPIIKVYYEDDKLMCSLENNIPGTDIRYTINNTYPVKFGITYSGPFEIPQGDLSLRTQTFRDGKPIGRQLQISREELEKRVRK
ncbi:MAG: family 20 glycosylhydrolase, partial [Flavobacteriaceae bacterium]|nr:family 20 glycosylhydrolase [Flavobacteriaceae bacterium]